jgi:hypothetical protein
MPKFAIGGEAKQEITELSLVMSGERVCVKARTGTSESCVLEFLPSGRVRFVGSVSNAHGFELDARRTVKVED